MKYEFIEKHRSEFGVEKMCQLLDVSRSGYYAWRTRPKSIRVQEDERLLVHIKQVFSQSRRLYGYPRVTRKLNADGIRCGKHKVARLMRENGLQARTKRKFRVTTNSRHNYPVAENVLSQGVMVDRPNQAWVADITYIPTDEGWLYLAAVMDLYSRQIVGWSMDRTMTQELVIDALKQARGRRSPAPGLIHHSDRGSQYASCSYQALLREYGFIPSMSRRGNCYDNACMESFFHTLKTELVYLTRYRTRAEARRSLFEYIECYYNRIRLHSALGYKSPCEYERRTLAA